MQHEITLALAQQANAIARTYHPAFYCSLNQVLGDLPETGFYYRRAVKVWYPYPTDDGQRLLNIVYCDHEGDDARLLAELQAGLTNWAALGIPPEDSLLVTEAQAGALMELISHSLTAPAERLALLKKFMHWHTRKEGRELAADLTAKIEERSPGVLTGRGWMPHGAPTPKPAINPYGQAA